MTISNLGHPLNLGLDWTAREVPTIRRETLQWLDTRSGKDWLEHTCHNAPGVWLVSPRRAVRIFLQQTVPMDLAEPWLLAPNVMEEMAPRAIEWYIRYHLRRMFDKGSTSYFVTPEMMALAAATAEALPENWRMEAADLPSPSGCMIFGDHDPYITELDEKVVKLYGRLKFAAVTWTPELLDKNGEDKPSLWVEWWIRRDDLGEIDDPARYIALPRELSWPRLVSDMESRVGLGEPVDPARRANKHLRLLYTIFQLMQQRQVAVAHEEPDRAEVKRNRRADIPNPAVRLIHLRRMSGQPSGNHRHVEWSKRWIVSAHWRQQPYKSTGEIRPKLIMPYVKGPEDKPLDTRPVVKVWSR